MAGDIRLLQIDRHHPRTLAKRRQVHLELCVAARGLFPIHLRERRVFQQPPDDLPEPGVIAVRAHLVEGKADVLLVPHGLERDREIRVLRGNVAPVEDALHPYESRRIVQLEPERANLVDHVGGVLGPRARFRTRTFGHSLALRTDAEATAKTVSSLARFSDVATSPANGRRPYLPRDLSSKSPGPERRRA